MIVKLLVEGGNMSPGPALAQKLGPMGINMGEVIKKINEETASFKGVKVPVELDVDPKTKQFTIKVSAPPVSELLKKELKLEKGSGDHKKIKVANISIEQIIGVAKTKLPEMLDRDLKKAVKSVIGTCKSLGVLVENKDPTEVEKEIEEGHYDSEIKEEKTQPSPEKKAKLDKFFKKLQAAQEKRIQEEEAAAAEAEKAKAEAAAEAAEGEAPAEGEEKPEGEEAPAEGEEAPKEEKEEQPK